jgi:hypothetical protein
MSRPTLMQAVFENVELIMTKQVLITKLLKTLAQCIDFACTRYYNLPEL